MPYEKAWMVGERSGVLQRLIGLYKFERAKAAYLPLADLLVASLPELPSNVIIVPIPTVWSHIRARGYDHMLLIAKRVAKLTNRPCSQVLTRKISSKQRQASAKQRARQAKQAFAVEGQIQPDKIYLIIDDVMTTGATIKYAAKTLRQAGAKHVWVAVIARQPKLGRSN